MRVVAIPTYASKQRKVELSSVPTDAGQWNKYLHLMYDVQLFNAVYKAVKAWDVGHRLFK